MKSKTVRKCTPTETKHITKKENRKETEIKMIKSCSKTEKAANDGSSAFDDSIRPTQRQLRNDHGTVESKKVNIKSARSENDLNDKRKLANPSFSKQTKYVNKRTHSVSPSKANLSFVGKRTRSKTSNKPISSAKGPTSSISMSSNITRKSNIKKQAISKDQISKSKMRETSTLELNKCPARPKTKLESTNPSSIDKSTKSHNNSSSNKKCEIEEIQANTTSVIQRQKRQKMNEAPETTKTSAIQTKVPDTHHLPQYRTRPDDRKALMANMDLLGDTKKVKPCKEKSKNKKINQPNHCKGKELVRRMLHEEMDITTDKACNSKLNPGVDGQITNGTAKNSSTTNPSSSKNQQELSKALETKELQMKKMSPSLTADAISRLLEDEDDNDDSYR